MTYADAIGELVAAAKTADVACPLEKPGDDATALAVFGAALVAEMNVAGYPGGLRVPMFAGTRLYAFSELERKQEGFRWFYDRRTHTRSESATWPVRRYVIAERWADAVSFDGEVFFTRRGADGCTHARLAPGLTSFFATIARWLAFQAGEADRREQALRQHVLGGLAERNTSTFVDFLLG